MATQFNEKQIENLRRKRAEYDAERKQAEQNFAKASEANDKAQMDRWKGKINLYNTVNKQIDKAIRREQKITEELKKQASIEKKAADDRKAEENRQEQARAKEKADKQAIIDFELKALKTDKARSILYNESNKSMRALISSLDKEGMLKRRAVLLAKAEVDPTSQTYGLVTGMLSLEKDLLKVKDNKSALAFDEESAQERMVQYLAQRNELETELLQSEEKLNKLSQVGSNATKDQIKDATESYNTKKKEFDSINQTVDEIKAQLDLTTAITREAKVKNSLFDQLLGILGTSVSTMTAFKEQAIAAMMAMKSNIFLLILGLITASVVAMTKFVNSTKELSKELNVSLVTSAELNKELLFAPDILSRIADKMLGVNLKDGAKSIKEATGNIMLLEKGNKDLFRTVERTAVGFGTTSDKVAGVAKQFQDITGETYRSSLNTITFVSALADAEGAGADFVLSDIAANTEAFAAFGQDGAKNMIEASIAARKLGSNLSVVTKIADQLLDFQGGIEKEMEASLLIGRQLNFNKARELALEGDIAGAARDVIKQIGGKAELQKMNVIQRRALAESIGVSVDELSRLAGGDLSIKSKDALDSAKMEQRGKAALIKVNKDLIKKLSLLTIAVGILTTALAVRFGPDLFKRFFGNRGGRGGGVRTSRGTPPSARELSRRGMDRYGNPIKTPGTSKVPKTGPGFFSRMGTKVKTTASSAVDSVKNIKNPLAGIKNPLAGIKNPLAGSASSIMNFGKDVLNPKNIMSGLKKSKGSIAALATSMLIDPLRNTLDDPDSILGKSMGVLDSTLAGAGTGALVTGVAGSVVPGVGNVVGGVGGGIAGGILGFGKGVWDEFGGELKSWWSGESKTAEVAAKANEKVVQKMEQVIQTGPMQGPPMPPAELTSSQKAQQAIEEKRKKVLAEEKKKQERDAQIQADKAILLQEEKKKQERDAQIKADKAILLEEEKKKQQEEIKKAVDNLDAGTKLAFTKRMMAEKNAKMSVPELKTKATKKEETIAKMKQTLADKTAEYEASGGGLSRGEKFRLKEFENKIQSQEALLKGLLEAIEAQTVAIKEGSEKQVKATKGIIDNN